MSSKRPSVNDVSWRTVSNEHGVKVESGDALWPGQSRVFYDSVWRVKAEGQRARLFWGESAWSDAERYAGDQRWIGGRTFS